MLLAVTFLLPETVTNAGTGQQDHSLIRIRDSHGEEFRLQSPPTRIIAIDSGAVEILFALEEGRRVVGTHRFLSFPPQADTIPRVGSAFQLDLEKIVALEPDLVVVFFGRFVSELRALGLNVLYLEPPATLEGVAERIRLWGKIVGRRHQSERLAANFQAGLKSIQNKLTAVARGPRVFHSVAPGLWTLGSGSLVNDAYDFLKAQNVFSDLSGAHQVSIEAILQRDPEVIISIDRSGEELVELTPVLKNLTAVKTGRVHQFPGQWISIAGPRLIQGLERLAEILYPKLFGSD